MSAKLILSLRPIKEELEELKNEIYITGSLNIQKKKQIEVTSSFGSLNYFYFCKDKVKTKTFERLLFSDEVLNPAPPKTDPIKESLTLFFGDPFVFSNNGKDLEVHGRYKWKKETSESREEEFKKEFPDAIELPKPKVSTESRKQEQTENVDWTDWHDLGIFELSDLKVPGNNWKVKKRILQEQYVLKGVVNYISIERGAFNKDDKKILRDSKKIRIKVKDILDQSSQIVDSGTCGLVFKNKNHLIEKVS